MSEEEEENENQDVCCICLGTNTTENEKIQRWVCSHRFHAHCIENWNGCCPLCRTANEIDIPPVTWSLSRNPRCILDIAQMKMCGAILNDDKKRVYQEKWKDQDCVSQNHELFFIHTFGVLGICETCTTIQSYNLMHVV